MANHPGKKNRTQDRTITASARAIRAAKRLASARAVHAAKCSSEDPHDDQASQLIEMDKQASAQEKHGDQENRVEKQVDQVIEEDNQGKQANEDEHVKRGAKRTWKKRPRTSDWILSAPAPGGPLSTELLRGYRGHVACDIWENNVIDRVSSFLFPLTRDLVTVKTYSWASAALAYLYRELGKASRAGCKQLAGPSTLLEAWIYEHFPMFRPNLNPNFIPNRHPRAMKWDARTTTPRFLSSLQAHRWRLDAMQQEEVIWMPYGADVIDKYPLSVYHGCIRYCSVIEPYMPDRVLRQFGYVQTRPMTPIKPNKEYKPTHSYSVEYGEGMMSFWDSPSSHCLSETRLGELALKPWDCSSDYMSWYSQRTHLKVQNPEHAPEDKAIAVVQEFENMNVASQQKGQGAKK
ncbi:Protein MAIN-LIKE 2 [Bienertia sinuspersici]